MIKTINSFEEIIDFAWELSQNNLYASYPRRLYNLKLPINQKQDFVEKITNSNFEEYAIFHDKYAIPIGMYYTSKNLQENIEHFRIFVFKQSKAIRASIFAKISKNSAEVFGLFIDKEYKNNGIESILINGMLLQLYSEFGAIKEIIYFIEEDCADELSASLAAGFEIKDNYRCYKCVL